nr:hypothetical protein [Tanacetum cinerariifolium]
MAVAREFVHLEELKVLANFTKLPKQLLIYFNKETQREAQLANELFNLMIKLLESVNERQAFIKELEHLRGNLVAYKMREELKHLHNNDLIKMMELRKIVLQLRLQVHNDVDFYRTLDRDWCFGDVKKFLKSGKLEKVFVIINSCTPNEVADLTVTFEDLSGIISSTIHYKVLTEERPKIEDKDSFEFKGQFLKELHDNTFSGLDHEDANEHIEKVLKIVDLFHILNITIDQVILRSFPMSLIGIASRWLRNKPSGSITTWEDLKTKFLSKYCPHARTAKKMKEINNFQSTETSDGLAAIQAQFNNLGRVIKKVNEKVYAAQVGCERCKVPHYTKDCPLKEEGNPRRSLLHTIWQSMEDALSKFMSESAKRYEENSNLIKEIRASMDAAIRNQWASIKTLEIQIKQMSKVLQERGFGSLLSSTKTNPRDHVKSISTIVEADSYPIRHIESSQYAVSTRQNRTLMYETNKRQFRFQFV